MRNFETKKLLSTCNIEIELSVGTAFELTLSDVPVRRGVICKVSPTRAWFLSKSANPHHLFAIDEDFSTEDREKLVVQGVVKFNDFIRKLPGSVRACGVAHRQKHRRLPTSTAISDDFIHPHLVAVALSARLPSSTRLVGVISPGCTPPNSPRPKKRAKPTIVSEVQLLKNVISGLQTSVMEMFGEIKWMRNRMNATSVPPPSNVDWS